jgi:hypothetical protein
MAPASGTALSGWPLPSASAKNVIALKLQPPPAVSIAESV